MPPPITTTSVVLPPADGSRENPWRAPSGRTYRCAHAPVATAAPRGTYGRAFRPAAPVQPTGRHLDQIRAPSRLCCAGPVRAGGERPPRGGPAPAAPGGPPREARARGTTPGPRTGCPEPVPPAPR